MLKNLIIKPLHDEIQAVRIPPLGMLLMCKYIHPTLFSSSLPSVPNSQMLTICKQIKGTNFFIDYFELKAHFLY